MKHEATVFHMCGGSGVGAYGWVKSKPRLANDVLDWKCVGSIDIDPDACTDFEMLNGVPAFCGDLHTMTPEQVYRYALACGLRAGVPPDAVFSSSPCKGLSRLLPTAKSKELKYRLLNELVYRSIFLACETWPRPPPLIVLENVPGIVSRGKEVLDRAKRILHSYGYLLHEGFHDCGEIGNLAQHRKRYLLVARQPTAITAFIHKPPKHKVRACGEVLSQLPVPIGPEGAEAGPMHKRPRLGWLTEVRLALIPAGGDWRNLPAAVSLGVDGSNFRGSPGLYRVVDDAAPWPTVTGSSRVTGSNGAAAVADSRVRRFNGSILGVVPFDQPTGVIGGESLPNNGRYSVADPRAQHFGNSMRVTSWHQPAGTVTAGGSPSNGAPVIADPRLITPVKPGQNPREVHARYDVREWGQPARTVAGSGTNGGFGVADPRLGVTHRSNRFFDQYKVRSWAQPAGAVTGATDSQAGAQHVADPRIIHRSGNKPRFNNNMRVGDWNEPSLCITSAARPDSGGVSVADPRPRAVYRNDTLGVVSWQEAAASITGSGDVQNGRFAVADPRKPLEGPELIIIAADGTWHRAITTLELAMLQALPATINGKPLVLTGTSSMAWRERIGNAVPADAATAIASSVGLAILASKLGTWFLSGEGIWVRERDLYAMAAEEAYAS